LWLSAALAGWLQAGCPTGEEGKHLVTVDEAICDLSLVHRKIDFMQILLSRILIMGALAGASFVAVADQAVASKPFLDCAASRASYLYLLKQSGYSKKDELQDVERDVQFYLQVAESFSERSLRTEFLKSGETEREKAEKLIKTSGSGTYLAHISDRKKECAALVRKHQKEIMKVADKLYGEPEKR
jgi:hypothetical protein